MEGSLRVTVGSRAAATTAPTNSAIDTAISLNLKQREALVEELEQSQQHADTLLVCCAFSPCCCYLLSVLMLFLGAFGGGGI